MLGRRSCILVLVIVMALLAVTGHGLYTGPASLMWALSYYVFAGLFSILVILTVFIWEDDSSNLHFIIMPVAHIACTLVGGLVLGLALMVLGVILQYSHSLNTP